MIDETHDPQRSSWVASANRHPDFPIQNLPLGVFAAGGGPRLGVAIGDWILDVGTVAGSGLLKGDALAAASAFSEGVLNGLLALGSGPRRALRRRLSELLSDPTSRQAVEPALMASADCTMRLPTHVGDYTDFYVGIHHATNIGRLFRPDEPLLPNYKHVPIGYHGRASSVRASGTPVRRPHGQIKPAGASSPCFAPTQRLDYELELGVWIGPGNNLGEPVPVAAASDKIAGLSLLNDWSARDLQAWEYQPLGPFLAKSFLTTVSPWIITAEALAPFRIAPSARPQGDPAPLPYLSDPQDQARGAFEIDLQVFLSTAATRAQGLAPHKLSSASARDMYWTVAQLVAHHTAGGCNLNPGDLLGTGTISAATPNGFGSLVELTYGGTSRIAMPSGETRTFLEDGDEVSFCGRLRADGYVSIGFGPCLGAVIPALEL